MKNQKQLQLTASVLCYVLVIIMYVFLFSSAEVSAQPPMFCGPWQKKLNGATSQARTGHIALANDTIALVGLGGNASIYFSDMWIYHAANDTFIPIGAFPGGARKDAAGFVINNKFYIGTGDSMGTLTKTFWEYDPTTSNWTQKANLTGSVRRGAVGFTINGKGYLGTGHNGTNYVADFYEYDPSGNSWTSKAPVPTPPGPSPAGRGNAFGFAIGNKGYVGGGIPNAGGPPMLNELNEYDPGGNAWTPKDSLTGARSSCVAFVINGKAYVGLGARPGGLYNNDLQQYNAGANDWTPVASFPIIGRSCKTGFAINGKAYLYGGQDVVGFQNDFWIYDTTVTPNSIYGIIRRSSIVVDTVDMVLIRKRFITGRWDTIQRRPSNANGEYLFTNVDSGTYVIYAKPHPVLTPHTSPTYYGNTHLWSNAIQINIGCTTIDTADINVIPFPPRSGNGRVNGYLYHGTAKRSEPIEDEDIIIEEVPPGTPIAYARTDANGFFQVDSLDPGNYRVVVEMAGMTMTSDLYVTVSGTDTVFENTDFIVDTTAGLIEPVDTTIVSVAEKNTFLLIYPNPAAERFTVSFARLKWKAAAVELYNMEGQLVMKKEEVLADRLVIERNNLPPGIYFIKIICKKGILKEKIHFD